jgi:hypothetical protein
MGKRNPQEIGTRRTATRRAGLDGYRLRGMWLKGSPANVPPGFHRHLVNVAFNEDGEIKDRAGLTRVNPTPLDSATACVSDLADFAPNTPYKIYCVFAGCPGLSATNGYSLNWYDNDQSSKFARGLYYNAAPALLKIGTFDGRIFIGDNDKLKAFTLIVPHYQDEQLALAGVEQAEVIHTFTGGLTIGALMDFDGKLFIGLNGGAGASKIAVWDGLTMHDGTNGTTADLTGIDPPADMVRWRDKLVVGLSTTGLRVRERGAVPGTWTTVASGFATYKLEAYRDDVYGTTAGTNVWRYDGTAVASVLSVTGAAIRGIAEHQDSSGNRYLFVGYQSSTNEAILARRDAAGTWSDPHKNLTAQDAQARSPEALISYRNQLVAGVNTSLSGGKLYLSPEDNTAGTYTIITPNVANNGAIQDMLAA